MGCVSSTFLSHDDEFPQIGCSAAFTHHIVSLTSSTYGLLNLDQDFPTTTVPPTPSPPPRPALSSIIYQPLESINSWELMSGLDADHIPSFRSKPLDPPACQPPATGQGNEENICPNFSRKLNYGGDLLETFELICPPNGENKLVIYMTTLRGVRKTFDDCNAVRSAIEGLGISVQERDISMDRGFRDELTELMKGRGSNELIPPRVFVKGKYIGGFEEVMRGVEEGVLGEFLEGLPRLRHGHVCEGCGGARFLPCSVCNGSCKTVGGTQGKVAVIVRCSNCNENGLVCCPVCS